MPETIAQFMARYPNPNATNVAGYVDGETFKYFESKSIQLPAVVNALEAVGPQKKYTNFSSHWVAPSGHPCPSVRSIAYLNQPTAEKGSYKSELQNESRWPTQIIGHSGDAPVPTGGLYREAELVAAHSLEIDKRPADPAAGSGAKGIRRALRLYLLACYAVLDRSAAGGFPRLNNYVSALLVSDTGKILAAGINTGSYRHAEVSLLLSYFRANPTAPKLPDRCVVFSTLTPCKQCSGYLKQAAPDLYKIYFGQDDPGTLGNKGRTISKQLSAMTKAPKGYLTPALKGEHSDDDFGAGVVTTGARSGIQKVAIRFGLDSCVDSVKSRAGQIGKAGNSRAILTSAAEMLTFKGSKQRADTEEQRVKRAVLDHINAWLRTADSVA